MIHRTFSTVFEDLLFRLRYAPTVENRSWQSKDVSDRPDLGTHEVLNYSFSVDLPTEDLDYYRQAIRPLLPWADDHFMQERVSGDPVNPGETWKQWRSAASAATHKEEQFDHSYAERYWPRFAGRTPGGILTTDRPCDPHRGIRFEYGDLNDLVDVLIADPTTRQAYLPVWFPEDLRAATSSKRVPCSLGYHFIVRAGRMHVVYYLRSCDYVRHFRDDIYLTVRLLLWVLYQCRLGGDSWPDVIPGTITMHITSMHIFKADYKVLFK